MKKRTWSPLIALCLALLSVLASVTAAQTVRPKIPPPDFKRECDVDAAGLRQWKPFDVPCPQCKGMKEFVCEHCKDIKLNITCLECDGKKRAPCRICAEKGKLPDPLVELACPYCLGSTWYPCGICNSFGSLKVDNVDTKCGACKQKGLLKCLVCDGKRRLETIKVGKKAVGEAGAKDLKEVLVKLHASLDELEKFEPDANPSKAAKALAKILEPLEKDLKAVKDMEKMLEEVLKGIKSYGAGYQAYEEDLKDQYFVFKDRTVFLLQHQIRAAEQSLERAEFNEAHAAK
jgi:hypothetical protein